MSLFERLAFAWVGYAMKLLLGKFASAWQLRYTTFAICLALLVYAVVMPGHSSESVNASAMAVNASTMIDTDAKSVPVKVVLKHASVEIPPSFGQIRRDHVPSWTVENQLVAARLRQVARVYEERELPVSAAELIHSLNRAAIAGDVMSQYLLGEAYQEGLGVPEDQTETDRWYARAIEGNRDAAAAGKPSAQGPKSFTEAFALYRTVAEAGDKNAQLYMGLVYDRGNQVARDYSSAANWFRKAAAQGSADAACDLGELYFRGDGVAKDPIEARRMLTIAAAGGCVNAGYVLGRLYREGGGAGEDATASAAWFEKAADRGSIPAQVALSSIYAGGEGVPTDTTRAYMWINLAAAHDPGLRELRDELETEIPKTEIQLGQEMTHAWLLHRDRPSLPAPLPNIAQPGEHDLSAVVSAGH